MIDHDDIDWPDDLAAAIDEPSPTNPSPVAKEDASSSRWERTVPIFKAGGDEQRYILGEVLIPGETDSQGDIYDEDTVRQAAHEFMRGFMRGKLGLQHEGRLTSEVDLLESYIAPIDMEIEGRYVKRGTWLMAWRVNDDQMWDDVKSGRLTGFSIGGEAIRHPLSEAA